MSISGTNSGLGIDQKEISEIQAPDSSAKNVKLAELQMNIAEELESNSSTASLDKVSQGRRTIALRTLQDALEKNSEDKGNLSKEQDLWKDLPESTRKLFEEYVSLFVASPKREKVKKKLTQKEFEKILSGKLKYLGKGQFGVVYESEDRKYALNVPSYIAINSSFCW